MLKYRAAWIIVAFVFMAGISYFAIKTYKENVPQQGLLGGGHKMLNVVVYGLQWSETYIINIYDNGDFNLVTGVRKTIQNSRVAMKQIDADQTFKMKEEDFYVITKYISEIDEQKLSISDVVAKGPPQIVINTKKTTYNGYLFATEHEAINSLVRELLKLAPIKLEDVIVSRY